MGSCGSSSNDSPGTVASPQQQLIDSIIRHDVPALERLLFEVGVDPATRNVHGNPVLHLAAARGYIDIIEILLRAGCPVSVRSEDLFSDLLNCQALHVVGTVRLPGQDVAASTKETIKTLLAGGADPNAQTAQGNTVLHRMVLVAMFPAIRYLIEQESWAAKDGCRVDLLNIDGKTPFDIAKSKQGSSPQWDEVVALMETKLKNSTDQLAKSSCNGGGDASAVPPGCMEPVIKGDKNDSMVYRFARGRAYRMYSIKATPP